MTGLTEPTDLEQAPVTHPHTAERPEPRRPQRRWLTAIIIFLLIAIPAGYVVISAGQSRDSGEDKQAEAALTGLSNGWPSRVQRRIYDVPMPITQSHKIYYYESNAYKTSSLYVEFETTRNGLASFLRRIGTSRAALDKGEVAITPKQAEVVGWDFTKKRIWAGMVNEQRSPRLTQRITVDLTYKTRPTVYIVSTAKL